MTTYQQQLQQAKNQIAGERQLFRKELASEQTRLLSAANEEAAAELQNIKDRVADEKQQALVELQGQAAPLAAQIAQKVVGRAL